MPHPLQQKIAAIRCRGCRFATLVYGIGWAMVVLLLSVLVIGGLDYFLALNIGRHVCCSSRGALGHRLGCVPVPCAAVPTAYQ